MADGCTPASSKQHSKLNNFPALGWASNLPFRGPYDKAQERKDGSSTLSLYRPVSSASEGPSRETPFPPR